MDARDQSTVCAQGQDEVHRLSDKGVAFGQLVSVLHPDAHVREGRQLGQVGVGLLPVGAVACLAAHLRIVWNPVVIVRIRGGLQIGTLAIGKQVQVPQALVPTQCAGVKEPVKDGVGLPHLVLVVRGDICLAAGASVLVDVLHASQHVKPCDAIARPSAHAQAVLDHRAAGVGAADYAAVALFCRGNDLHLGEAGADRPAAVPPGDPPNPGPQGGMVIGALHLSGGIAVFDQRPSICLAHNAAHGHQPLHRHVDGGALPDGGIVQVSRKGSQLVYPVGDGGVHDEHPLHHGLVLDHVGQDAAALRRDLGILNDQVMHVGPAQGLEQRGGQVQDPMPVAVQLPGKGAGDGRGGVR